MPPPEPDNDWERENRTREFKEAFAEKYREMALNPPGWVEKSFQIAAVMLTLAISVAAVGVAVILLVKFGVWVL